jgi:hypothetical protein
MVYNSSLNWIEDNMDNVIGLQTRMLKQQTSPEVYNILEDAIEAIKFLEAQVSLRNGEIKKLKEKNARQVKMLTQCGYGE